MKKITVVLIILLTAGFVYSQNSAKEGYKIANKFKLEGDEKWDYLFSDDTSGRVYVSHGTMVQAVDQSSGKVAGKVTGLDGVHGIAIAPALNKGFISTKNDNSVTIFDTKTFTVIKKIEVTGKSPDAILFDSFSNKVFVFNGHSNNVSVLNAETNAIVATIDLTGNPEAAASDGNGKIFVNLESASSVAVINAVSFKVENVWPIAPGTEPTGLALDNETHRLFSAGANKLLIVLDAETGKVITTLPIGEKCDGAAFDPALKCVYTSNGEGTVTVVKEVNKDSFVVSETIKTQKGAKTITLNKQTHHIYTTSADFEAQTGTAKSKLIPGTFVVIDIAPL